MRLWHKHILSRLPWQQLLGQHRKCAPYAVVGGDVPFTEENQLLHTFNYKNHILPHPFIQNTIKTIA